MTSKTINPAPLNFHWRQPLPAAPTATSPPSFGPAPSPSWLAVVGTQAGGVWCIDTSPMFPREPALARPLEQDRGLSATIRCTLGEGRTS